MAVIRFENDNTDEVIRAKEEAVRKALEMIGMKCEKYAKALCPVDTGNLRNSITHQVDDNMVSIGSQVEYAPYVELGTGQYFTPPPEWIEHHGKKGKGIVPWKYQDEQGNWHLGYPMRARPFIKPAVENHVNEFEGILKNELENA